MFVFLPYTSIPAIGATVDQTAVADPDFSQRNGHFVFTEPYNIIGMVAHGSNITAATLTSPTWNAYGQGSVYPPLASTGPSANDQIDIRKDFPLQVPLNEEIQTGVTDTGGAGTTVYSTGLWLATPDHNYNNPSGVIKFKSLAVSSTFTTPTIRVWSSPGTLTFTPSLRGGVYSVVGVEAHTSAANSLLAFRIIFPRQKLYSGRKLRPGNLVSPTNSSPSFRNEPFQSRIWGEWGRFHTFELPAVEILPLSAGTQTLGVMFSLVYLGTDVSLLDAGASTI